MSTPAEILKLGEPDPEFAAAWKANPVPPISEDVYEARATLAEAKRLADLRQGPLATGVTETDITVPARDGYAIPVRVYSTGNSGGPVLVAFHGGGFVLGDLAGEEARCRAFAAKFGCVCFNVDYRLAPQHKFPAAPHDAWDATKWVAANAHAHGGDPRRGFVVMGTSAGGNLTDVVGHLARDEQLSPPLTGLLELIPALLPETVVPAEHASHYLAFEQNADAPIMGQKLLRWFRDHYQADDASPLRAPFNHPDGHAGLPPVVLQVCGMDPLRDDALIYERVLREQAGVRTRLYVYPGVPHTFYSFFPDLEISKRFGRETVEGMQWLLEQGGK